MSSQTSGLTDRSSSSVNSTSSTQLAAANPGRQYLLIQNLSDVVVYIRLGSAAAVIAEPGTIYLAANGGVSEWQGETWVPGTAVSAISATGSGKTVTCLEA